MRIIAKFSSSFVKNMVYTGTIQQYYIPGLLMQTSDTFHVNPLSSVVRPISCSMRPSTRVALNSASGSRNMRYASLVFIC